MKQKIIVMFLMAITVISIMFGVTGCTNKESDHVHTYSDAWTYDDTYHWHESTCGHS